MAYLHGAYGEIGESKVASVTQADVVAAYIGTAPVNLIRGYADKDLNADLYRGIFEQIKRYQDFADKFKQKLLSDLSIGLYLKSACSY